MSTSANSSAEDQTCMSLKQLLMDATQNNETDSSSYEMIVLRKADHIEGAKPDMSKVISQHLSALSDIQYDDFHGYDLGIPLQPPPRP